MNRRTRDRVVYENAYDYEEKPIPDLSPGDILVRPWEVGQPYGVVNGPSKTGRDIVPDQPDSADFVFVPIRPIESGWDNSTNRLVHVENVREDVYVAFSPRTDTTPVAVKDSE